MLSTVCTHPRLAAVALGLAFSLSPSELKLKESDHKALAKLVGDYFTALDEEKEIIQTLTKVVDQLPTLEKKLKGGKLLAAVGDWEQVFRLVTEDRLSETLKKKGEVTATKLKVKGGPEVSAAYCAPKKAPKGALPLVLIACDAGESPSDHLNAHWNDPALREVAFLVAIELGKDQRSWGMFGSPAEPGGAFQLMTALAAIQKEFPIDCNRRYLAGSGKGFAAVELTAVSYPLFAGIIGIGDVTLSDPEVLENFRALPTLLLKGGEGAKAIETKIGELGFGNCRVEAEGGVAQAAEWIGKTQRDAYPAHLTFAPRIDTARFTHWLSLTGFQSSEKPRVDAKADRESNTITIDAQKVAELTVYLNDELVDLEKPVRFVINGTVQERTVERNAPEMIKSQYYGGDWGRVFTATVSERVPEK
jgi:hypothetical protein